MSDIRLDIPEGYFEKSLERTMASASRIRRRRKMTIAACAAVVVVLAGTLGIGRISERVEESEYLAQQADLAELDIFLEINR